MEITKVLVVGDNPEKLAVEYMDYPLIVIYPKNRAPTKNILTQKNVTVLYSEYTTYPDIESLKIVRDMLFYLLNTSYLNSNDVVLLLFEKNGEKYQITLDLREMQYPLLVSRLGDLLDGEIIENILRLSMEVIRKGREGMPTGALFIVGDEQNVKKYIIQKIANPIKSLSRRERLVTDPENMDTLREYAIMDGAMVIDSMGYVVTCGAYVKSLFVDEANGEGFGGRHLAGLSITKLTRAISFVVSSEGTIRVYRDGKIVYQLDSF